MKKLYYIIRILIGALLAVLAYRFIMKGTFNDIDYILLIAMPVALIITTLIKNFHREKEED